MDEATERARSLPIDTKPFRVRAQEGWASFLAGEEELRGLLDQKDRQAVSRQLVERCAQLLKPAFDSVAFELGHNGQKYELVLTPEGDRTRLFQLACFRRQAPAQVLERWSIRVGRFRSEHYILRMYGLEIALPDVQVWAEPLQSGGVKLALYCEKLLPMLREDENRAYGLMYILLDQALGELAAMRYVDGLELLSAPGAGESMGLDRLAGYIAREVDPEGWDQAAEAEFACERYTAYRGNPSEEEDWALRQDIFAGVTSCVPLIQSYYRGEDYLMDRLYRDGVTPGFLFYPLEGIDRKEVLDLRDRLEEEIRAKAGDGAVTFTGGATGTVYGYLDFIAWDLRAVLDSAVEVFDAAPVAEAGFHTFYLDARGIRLKGGA